MPARSSPLHRLHKTKFTLLAAVSAFVGLGLLFWAHWAEAQRGWAWLANLPAIEIGGGLFFAGLFGVLFQYIGQADAEELARERFREVLAEEAPAMRDAVVNGFAFEPEKLVGVASPATLDQVIENCLAIRLGDKELAADAYAELREQAVRATERRYDMDIAVALAPAERGPRSGEGSMFVATIRWEYRVRPASRVMRIACVSDIDEYRELLDDPSCTVVHYFKPVGTYDAASEDAFQLLEATVDGASRPARRVVRSGTQVYTVSLGEEATTSERTISYTYRVLIKRNSHLLHLDVSRPTKNLKVQFAYGHCGIRHVNVLDYIASSRQPRISRRPATEPTPNVEVGFDGWVFPKAGVAFVWVLDEELAPAAGKPDVRPLIRPT